MRDSKCGGDDIAMKCWFQTEIILTCRLRVDLSMKTLMFMPKGRRDGYISHVTPPACELLRVAPLGQVGFDGNGPCRHGKLKTVMKVL